MERVSLQQYFKLLCLATYVTYSSLYQTQLGGVSLCLLKEQIFQAMKFSCSQPHGQGWVIFYAPPATMRGYRPGYYGLSLSVHNI